MTANVIRLKLATLLENLFEASGKLNEDTNQLLQPKGMEIRFYTVQADQHLCFSLSR